MPDADGPTETAVNQDGVAVASQPVLDKQREVVAYSLLFRDGLDHCLVPESCPTREILSNSLFVIGFEELTDGKKGLIRFSKDLLVSDIAAGTPPDRVAIEIPEGIEPEREVLRACQRLQAGGRTLVVPGTSLLRWGGPWLEVADIARVHFASLEPEQFSAVGQHLAGLGISTLADGLETIDHYEQARDAGYALFQGGFFSKPVVSRGREIRGNQVAYFRLLNAVNQLGISYDELEGLVKQDVALAYKLLRFMNSAWFGFRCEIRSIKHALVLLGPREIRKWLALVALRHMLTDKPKELVVLAMTRAKVGEDLAAQIGLDDCAAELFLMGMFSTIDALTDLAMAEALAKLPLTKEVKTALLGRQCPLRVAFDLIRAYEQGRWEDFSHYAVRLSVPENLMPRLYTAAVKWSRRAFAAF